MKITKQMIYGMGGPESKYYEKFLEYCCQAFNIIRKSANLFLNLLSLMRDANIPDMAPDPNRVIDKVRHLCWGVDATVAAPQVSQSIAAFFLCGIVLCALRSGRISSCTWTTRQPKRSF